MAIRTILNDETVVLRKKSREITEFNSKLWNLLDDLRDTMYGAEGVGLAAPQVGILRRAAVIDVGDGLVELINPVIVFEKGRIDEQEGCLSFPSLYGTVTRPARVEIDGYDRFGKKVRIKGSEYLARAMCHEIDHLDGVLFMDIARGLHKVSKEEREKIARQRKRKAR
ncbi:MAG: peptide deformylase [Oscillospiraceae bacterium]|nr:peptide deformylase [Oscillospiraceae bacterium]